MRMAARRAGRLPTRQEWERTQPRPPGVLTRILRRGNSGHSRCRSQQPNKAKRGRLDRPPVFSDALAACPAPLTRLQAHLQPGRCERRRPVRVAERGNVGGIDLVPVLGHIAHLHVLVGHPQRDEHPDQLQQDERDQCGPDDHPEGGQGLPLEQRPVAEQDARDTAARDDSVLGRRVEQRHVRIGEDADQQAAREPGETVV